MAESPARAQFFAEMAATADVVLAPGSSSAASGEPDDPEAKYRAGARILKATRLVYSYQWLFGVIIVALTVLAIVGAVLMVQRVRV